MKVRAKVTEINAICHPGPSPLTVMGAKGQQEAKKGDYIFMHGTDPSTFEVVKKADFDDKYEVVAEVPVAHPAPVEPLPPVIESDLGGTDPEPPMPHSDEEKVEEPTA